MSGILKPEEALEAPQPPAWRALQDKNAFTSVVDREIAALKAHVAQLEEKLEAKAGAYERALAAARDEGAREAKAGFVRDEAEALATLKAAGEDAMRTFEIALAGLERLAPAMCEAVLETAFGAAGLDDTRISAAIGRQMAALRRESVTYIAVSGDDFSEATAISALEAAHPALSVRVDPNLARGECRVGLELGHVELSIDDFRNAVNARLREWAAP